MQRGTRFVVGFDVSAMLWVVGCGLVSLLLWRGEIVLIKGVQGSAWLRGYPWSALPICFLVAISALVSVPELLQRARPVRVGFVLSSAIVNWGAFEIARRWFYSWPGRPAFAPDADWFIFSPLLSVLLVAFSLHQGIRRLALRAAGYRYLPVFVVALVLILPLSWLTAVVFPPYGGHQFDDVKAGYPVFWVNIMVGAACALVSRRSRRAALTQP